MSNIYQLESTADLLPALDNLHELIQLMQGNNSFFFAFRAVATRVLRRATHGLFPVLVKSCRRGERE